ncbi:MAG: tetratricopeptide repeat protein, partial [Anaerolineales bacterium]|nr:tetratricopeptide repeat protein [Anaerolineales bacterium]
MGQVEKTVFISYRRTNLPWALNIYQNLTAHGYDVFFDYESIPSGDFEQIILENIRGRAHFLVVLTPSMLERIDEPNDWVRREIETALDENRNIVSLFFEGFDFSDPYISGKLTGKLELLKKYAGFDVPASYFGEAMDRLRNRYLNVSLDIVKHPVSPIVQKASQKQQFAASKAEPIKEIELTAQEWFEKGLKSGDLDEQILFYTNAIGLKPNYPEAYNNRALVRKKEGDLDGAIKDFNEAIRLKPDYPLAYNNRGNVRAGKGVLGGAIQDYNEAIRLNPYDARAYYNRGNARKEKGDLDGAIKDYNEAIRLNPDDARAYYNRGNARKEKGDLD